MENVELRVFKGTRNNLPEYVAIHRSADKIQAIGPERYILRGEEKAYVAYVKIRGEKKAFEIITREKIGTKSEYDVYKRTEIAGGNLKEVNTDEGVYRLNSDEIEDHGPAGFVLARAIFGTTRTQLSLNGGDSYECPVPPLTFEVAVLGKTGQTFGHGSR